MVDVGDKAVTRRTARAEGIVLMQPETLRLVRERDFSKGNVLEVARLAGIMAAKRTGDLIPLCHLLPLEKADVQYSFPTENSVRVEVCVSTDAKTGIFSIFKMPALLLISFEPHSAL